MYPRPPVKTEVMPETYERLQEALYPKGPAPAKDESMGILKTLLERAKKSDETLAELLTKVVENEEEIAKEAKKQTAALERGGTGEDSMSGPFDSAGAALNEMNYNGADSRMED
jgi:hypothetical protein